MERAQLMQRMALDVVLWYFVPVCFVAAYVTYFAQPSASVGPHILLVTLPFLVLQALRLLLQRLTARTPLRHLLIAALMTVLCGLMLTYYLLVIVGLRSWGGVVARDVIPTFFAQTAVLTDTLAVPPLVFPLAAVVLLAPLFGPLQPVQLQVPERFLVSPFHPAGGAAAQGIPAEHTGCDHRGPRRVPG